MKGRCEGKSVSSGRNSFVAARNEEEEEVPSVGRCLDGIVLADLVPRNHGNKIVGSRAGIRRNEREETTGRGRRGDRVPREIRVLLAGCSFYYAYERGTRGFICTDRNVVPIEEFAKESIIRIESTRVR